MTTRQQLPEFKLEKRSTWDAYDPFTYHLWQRVIETDDDWTVVKWVEVEFITEAEMS